MKKAPCVRAVQSKTQGAVTTAGAGQTHRIAPRSGRDRLPVAVPPGIISALSCFAHFPVGFLPSVNTGAHNVKNLCRCTRQIRNFAAQKIVDRRLDCLGGLIIGHERKKSALPPCMSCSPVPSRSCSCCNLPLPPALGCDILKSWISDCFTVCLISHAAFPSDPRESGFFIPCHSERPQIHFYSHGYNYPPKLCRARKTSLEWAFLKIRGIPDPRAVRVMSKSEGIE